MMKKLSVYMLLCCICLFTSGCATVMAAKQPGKKNMNVLTQGTPRDAVVMELGAPIMTETDSNGKKVDYFKFVQGYSQANKTVRVIGHGVADVMTLGLWEVVGTPTEATFRGKDVAVKVTYDNQNHVEQVAYQER